MKIKLLFVSSALGRISSVIPFLLTFGICVLAQESKPGAVPPLQSGTSDAQFKIEVFNDYQCGACAAFNSIIKNVEKSHNGKVLIIYRNFPLPIPAHNNSYAAARAVEAAGIQGKFREMMELTYKGQPKWSQLDSPETIFYKYAKKIRLNVSQFKRDYNGYVVALRIDRDLARARSLELTSTPSVVLNGNLLTFAESIELERLISESIK